MNVDNLEIRIAHDFSVLQENLDKPYNRIETLLRQQGQKQVRTLSDATLQTCCIQCETTHGNEIRFIIPWKYRKEKGVKCRKDFFQVDMETPVNPYLIHCFAHYQRLNTLEWIDPERNDLITLHIFDMGFVFAFHRMDRQEIVKYRDHYMSSEKHPYM